jgi:CRP-like cAMP-binding protein
MDLELPNRTQQVRFVETVLAIVSRKDFVAMKALAGGPVDLADARTVIDVTRESLDVELLRRLAQCFGRDAARVVDDLLGAEDG